MNASSHTNQTDLTPSRLGAPLAAQSAETVYLLGRSDSETERLVRQAELHRRDTRELLDASGLRAGQRALDLGCGPLGILDELAERVGPAGRVVGLERAAQFRAHAESHLRGRGFSNFDLIAGHARHTELPSGHFDFSHARLLLVNLPRPQEVVEELVRVTVRGGTVALHDVDWNSWTCEPMCDAWIRLKRAARAVWQHNGLDVQIGRRLPELLRKAGVADVHVQLRTFAWNRSDPQHTFLLAILRRVRGEVVARGLLGEAEVDRFAHDLAVHLAKPDTLILSPTYFQVWGRKT